MAKQEVGWRDSRMASQLVVPPSKHTLFMRGFSSRQDIKKIREYFQKEAGGTTCTVEFFKHSDTGDKLFVALRFETKDTARDIFNRFNNHEVLGDRITITWFKDLRKARQKGLIPSWGKPYDDRRMHPGNLSPLRNGYRPGKYKHYYERNDRGSDRWRRNSGSRHHDSNSRSRSRGKRQSGDGSNSRSRSRSRSPRSDRSYSNSPSRSRSGSPRSWTGSPDRARSLDRDRDIQKPHSPDRHQDRSLERREVRSADRENHSKWEMSPDMDKMRSPDRRDADPDGKKWTKDTSPRGADPRKRDRSADENWDPSPRQRGNWIDESPGQNRYPRSAVTTVDRDKEDAMEADMEPYGDNGYHRPSDPRYYDGQDGYPRRQRSHSPGGWRGSTAADANKRSRTPPPLEQESPRTQQYSDYERPESVRRRDKYTPEAMSGETRRRSLDRDEGYTRERRESESVDVKRRKYEEEGMVDSSAQGKGDRLSKDHHFSRGHKRNRSDHFADAEDGAGRASDIPQQQSQLSAAEREVERGMLGLPVEKMGLVRQKKEEIEKAYRQDCETFASVVKMLISKDVELENHVQSSLRENLKEIGQRCIQELREFIDKLKADDK